MSKDTVVNRRFADLTEQLKQSLDECYFEMLGLDEGVSTNWTLPEDSHMTYQEAGPYIENWTVQIEQLDSAAFELQKLQLFYYQRLHWPELKPIAPEQIIKRGKLIVSFAIHRALWVLRAYQTQDPAMLKLLTPHRKGELLFKTIAREIGASPDAVAHWHKFTPIPKSATVIDKLETFYGLGMDDALYYSLPEGQLIPWHMIRDYRG